MHEMAIVESIMEIVENQIRQHNAARAVRISLEFGALTAVVPAAIDFAFQVLSKGTVADGAALDITMIPIKVHCFECGKQHELELYQPFCPSCSSAAMQIVRGKDEMRIVSLEIEDR